MTGTEIRVTGLDENSFRTLHVSILQKTNRAELTLGAAIHPPTLTHGEFRGFSLNTAPMSLSNKNNRLFGGELAGSCLAVIASVPLTAWLGRLFGTTYDMRVAIYGGLLLWVVVGAVSIFLITRGSAVRLTLGKIGLWFVSTWLWPIPLAMHCLKNKKKR